MTLCFKPSLKLIHFPFTIFKCLVTEKRHTHAASFINIQYEDIVLYRRTKQNSTQCCRKKGILWFNFEKLYFDSLQEQEMVIIQRASYCHHLSLQNPISSLRRAFVSCQLKDTSDINFDARTMGQFCLWFPSDSIVFYQISWKNIKFSRTRT